MVSIIIPCYNGSPYIRDCVNSLLALTIDPKEREVIFIDDGSTDDSVDQIREALDVLDNSFLLRNTENMGPGAARNSAIDFAQGEYILPMDVDNLFVVDAVEKYVRVCEKGFIAYSDGLYFGERNGYWKFSDWDAELLMKRNIMENMSMYKREWWQEVGGYDETRFLTTYEDWEFWIRLMKAGYKGKRIPEPLFMYRFHSDSRNQVAQKDHGKLVKYIMEKNKNGY